MHTQNSAPRLITSGSEYVSPFNLCLSTSLCVVCSTIASTYERAAQAHYRSPYNTIEASNTLLIALSRMNLD